MSRTAVIKAIEAARTRGFRPGSHDCALFAAEIVKAKTGRDYAEEWRGKYRTLEDGQKALQERGYKDHIDLVASTFEEIPVAMAQFGDLVAVDDALGVVSGGAIFVLRPDGLGTLDLLSATRAFRVK